MIRGVVGAKDLRKVKKFEKAEHKEKFTIRTKEFEIGFVVV